MVKKIGKFKRCKTSAQTNSCKRSRKQCGHLNLFEKRHLWKSVVQLRHDSRGGSGAQQPGWLNLFGRVTCSRCTTLSMMHKLTAARPRKTSSPNSLRLFEQNSPSQLLPSGPTKSTLTNCDQFYQICSTVFFRIMPSKNHQRKKDDTSKEKQC